MSLNTPLSKRWNNALALALALVSESPLSFSAKLDVLLAYSYPSSPSGFVPETLLQNQI